MNASAASTSRRPPTRTAVPPRVPPRRERAAHDAAAPTAPARPPIPPASASFQCSPSRGPTPSRGRRATSSAAATPEPRAREEARRRGRRSRRRSRARDRSCTTRPRRGQCSGRLQRFRSRANLGNPAATPAERLNRRRKSLSSDPRPLLVFFSSQRSGPARRMESLLAHLARKERARLRVTRVDVEDAAGAGRAVQGRDGADARARQGQARRRPARGPRERAADRADDRAASRCAADDARRRLTEPNRPLLRI